MWCWALISNIVTEMKRNTISFSTQQIVVGGQGSFFGKSKVRFAEINRILNPKYRENYATFFSASSPQYFHVVTGIGNLKI
jgi:hypothetical protein